MALNFLDKIGPDIDFCLFDTRHISPGEILDFLMVLPYLNKQATIVFHDTSVFMGQERHVTEYFEVRKSHATSLLMSAISGQKLIPAQEPYHSIITPSIFTNIGAIEINENTFKKIYEVFNILRHQWYYMPPAADLIQFANFLTKFYDEYYVKYFEGIVKWQERVFEENRQDKLKKEEKEEKKVLNKHHYTLWEQIFSVRNEKQKNKNYYHKVICILGFKIKMRINN